MKKVLVGYIGLGKTSGIDKYLFSFLDKMKEENVQVDFLTRFEDKELKDKLENEGCKVFKVSRNRHFIRQFREMKKIIKENNYDVGYFNISTAFNCIGVISSKIFGIKKTVVHSHSSSLESHNPIVKRILYFINSLCKPIISACSDLNLAVSDKAAKWMFSRNVYDNDDYLIMYNAVDYNRFKYNEEKRKKIRKQFGIDDKFVVGHVGRFSYPKNHKFLFKVFEEYKKINPNSVLVCVGEGEDYDNIVELSKKMGLYDSIIFTGPINNVDELYQAFDCLLLPSKFEGLPVVGIEVQFSQTKCIFSDRITKMAKISDDTLFLPITNAKLWAKNISSKKIELNKDADNFKLEKCKEQFNYVLNETSGKYNFASIFFKIILILHYLLNLTVFFNGFNYLMPICGLLLIPVFFSKRFSYIKTKIKDYKIYLLYLLFLISYIITFAITKRYDIDDSVKTFIWTILHMFFIFNTSYMNNIKDLKKEVYMVFKFAVLCLSIINLNNLYLLINHVQSTAISFESETHLLGITKWGRFYGNFYDANYASVAAVGVILMTIYLFKKCKSKVSKVLLVLSILLQTMYIYFGESRTGLVTFGVAFGLFIIMTSILNKFNIKRLLLMAIVFFAGIFVLPTQSLKFYSYIINNNLTDDGTEVIVDVVNPNQMTVDGKNPTGNGNNAGTASKKPKEIIKIGRTDYNDDYSNGRIDIWKSGLQIFEKNKIIGIGYANIVDYSLDKAPNSFVSKHKFAAFHNVAVDLLVSQGIIGFVMGAGIILYYFIKSIILFRVIKKSNDYYLYVTLTLVLLSVLVSSMFVSQIFYINNFVTFMFWLILGYLNALLINSRRNYEK